MTGIIKARRQAVLKEAQECTVSRPQAHARGLLLACVFFSLFSFQKAFNKQRDSYDISKSKYRPIEMRLKVRLGYVRAGYAKRDNNYSTGGDKTQPVYTARPDRSAPAVAIEYYHSKGQQYN